MQEMDVPSTSATPGAQAEVAPPIAVPWTPRDVLWGFLIWAGLTISLVLVEIFAPAPFVERSSPALFAVGEAGLLIPGVVLAIHKRGARWQDLGLRPFGWKVPAIGCAGLVILYVGNFFYSLLLSLFSLQVQPMLVPVMSESRAPIVILAVGVLLAPPVEEVFFRGFVFGGLRTSMGWRKAALLSSLLFSLSHLTPTAILPIFAIGWLFSFLYERSRSIWPCTLLHALINLIGLGAAYLLTQLGGAAIPP